MSNNNLNYQDLNELKNQIDVIIQTNNLKEIKQLIKILTNQLNQWSREYYILNQPTVDDFTYDQVLKQLEQLEQQFPQFVQDDTPSKHVGTNVSDNKFAKYTHQEPMLSLQNSYNSDDIDAFYENIVKQTNKTDLDFVCEPKIDGLSISCIYQNGVLVKGITRGDGKVGEDVTANILTIESIPKTIPYLDVFEARGEVYLPKSVLSELNKSNNFANTRNTASGALRNLDPEVTRSRHLSAWFYFIPNYVKNVPQTQYEDLLMLQKLGFPVALEMIKKVQGIKSVNDYITWFDTQRASLNYDVDGVVIKVNDKTLYNELGITSKYPKYAIAYKYPPTLTQTKLLDIILAVGRTGKITYTAKLEPVLVSGSIISYATLHNADYITQRDIRIGDIVSLYKAAEVIPQIAYPLKQYRTNNETKAFITPTTCPTCSSTLVQNDGEVDLYCINENCPSKKLQQLIYFASKPVMNLETLSDKTIQKFFNLGYLTDLASFYTLKNHYDEIINNPDLRIKNKMLDKILINIDKSKTASWDKVLTGLGIKFVGKETAKLISKYYYSFNELKNAKIEELSSINQIGLAVANSIKEWFSKESSLALLEALSKVGLKIQADSTNTAIFDTSSMFYQKAFVITGSFDLSRDEISKYLIEHYDAKIQNSVTKNTDYVLVGLNPGSKYDKAKTLNIHIITDLNTVIIKKNKTLEQ